MSDLLHKAELQKLAVVLGTPVAELAFLSHLELDQLRGLRHACSAWLFDRHSRRFKRLAESTKLLPRKVVALICEKVIPAQISAQVTGLLQPEAAVELAERLPLAYQADICVAMDPRRAIAVLQAMPVSNVIAVAHELVKRREFMTMAQFVDALTQEQIARVARELNGEAMLKVGFYVESSERLNTLIGLLDEDQLNQTIKAATLADGALWPEVLSLSERLMPEQRQRMGGLLAASSPEVLASLNTALFERDLWPDAVAMLDAMDDAAQELIIASLGSHAENTPGTQAHLQSLLPRMSDRLRRKIQITLGLA